MAHRWSRYLRQRNGDAGRALVAQGRRIAQARRELSPRRYSELLERAGLNARDASVLATCGDILGPLLDISPDVRLPFRARTLTALTELPFDVLRQAANEGIIRPSMTEAEVKSLTPSARQPVTAIIRPSDNWSFGRLQWPRIDGEDSHGYIPGDLYANCLWYYARDGDTVVDPTAGSGMLQQVWDDRSLWLGEPTMLRLDIVLSDLTPRGLYRDRIHRCDLLSGFPVAQADYIIIDPPYCGIATGQYSDLESDLANMEPDRWQQAMVTVAERLRTAQAEGGRCTVIVPNKRELTDGARLLFPDIVRQIWAKSGYRLHDVVYASRRIQQRQARKMAILNNLARRRRVPLSDISEVLTFTAC